MTDIQTHLNKIRSDASECMLLSSLGSNGKQREVFARAAQHLNSLASEIEKTIASNAAIGSRGENVNLSPPPTREEAVGPDMVAANVAVTHHQSAAQPRRILRWLLVLVLAGIVGAFFWANKPANDYWTFLPILLSKHEASPPAPLDDTKQAINRLLSGEQADRKILMEQMSALAVRLDGLVTALDNLKASLEKVEGPPNKVGVEGNLPPAEPQSQAPETKPIFREEKHSPTPAGGAGANEAGDVRSAIGNPESVDRVGAIAVPPRQAELEPRKPSVGPPGCSQFRSFDPASGTYITLEGRRRECRH